MVRKDPRDLIKSGSMTPFQLWIVAFCTLIAGLDGFDVLVMAFVAPSVAAHWGLSGSALGALFSAGLLGMGIGAFLVAPLGDRYGRRPTVLLCLSLLLVSMLWSAMTGSVYELFAARLLTGIGVGAVLATINIVVTEYANQRRRSLCNAIISLGYPIGATLGGLISVFLIDAYGWRAPFVFGGTVALVMLPLAWMSFPESLDFLLERRTDNALNRVNRILPRLRQAPLVELPPRREVITVTKTRPLELLTGEQRVPFLAACAIYFCVMMTFYFMVSWTPKILTDAGLSLSGGISGSMLLSIGGAVGCLLYGLLANRYGARRLAAGAMIGLFVMMMLFSVMSYEPLLLIVVALTLGFFLYTTIAVLYVAIPVVFPVTLRSTGTGLAMGMGRIGAVVGPYVAGVLIELGWERSSYFLVLALPVLVAALLLSALRNGTPATMTTIKPTAEAGG
ncbi:MFS transporter [Phytohalomonas tamaricis]|uniref:MFS transporter n=1 Tax=Phytohalomonas tamaricis TaxID=2081032 RepID=UPI000D0B2D8E|nr:MFS transporter [Phytohalomonas tamaricis]